MSWSVGSSALWGPVSKAASEKTGRRILIAEDSTANSISLLRILESLGHQVVLASSGRQALAEFGALSFDLIFMDCHMPDMDGYEATRRIRNLERKRAVPPTPIVAMTANAMEGDREACLQAGMDDYLAKPVTPEALKEKLKRNLLRHEGDLTRIAA